VTEDAGERFRALPGPVRPEDLVETSDASTPPEEESDLERDWRTTLRGSGG